MDNKEEIIKKIWDAISVVEDPEIGMTLTELGLIYDVNLIEDSVADIIMTFTSMGCPYGPQLQSEIKEAAEGPAEISEARVEVVFTPPWDPHSMASEDAKMHLGIF